MKKFLFQSIFALCIAAFIGPAHAHEHSVSRRLHIDYSINDTYINMSDPGIYANGTIIATNYIGSSVLNQSVGVNLLNFGCDFEVNKTGMEVELSNVTEYFQGGVFQWKIQVIPERLTQNKGGLVNYTNTTTQEHRSTGTIQFCTRVSSWLYDIQVGFRENNFELRFDMTNNTFAVTGVGLADDAPDTFVTDVDNPFTLDACQCADFACITTPASPVPIPQETSLVICLTPGSATNPSAAKISNFNLRIVDSINGAVTYDPVTMGGTTWSANPITLVQEDPNSNTIMITAPIVAQFFVEGVQQIDAIGNAFLEFVGKAQQQTFSSYGLTFQLKVIDEEEPGCLDRLFAFFF